MRTRKKFQGVVIPAVTPLKKALTLDEAAAERMFNHFHRNNVHPFILGTTGESASLPLNVKKEYMRAATRYRKGDTVLYAGISSNCLQESIDFAKYCADAGADAAVATLPSYYTLTAAQMTEYFIQLADKIKLPLIVYNIPATTHISIPLEVIDALSQHSNITGLKDSERSEERLEQSLRLWKDREDFSYFIGWAARSAPALLRGADGIIPSTGNLLPAIYNEMQQAVAAGDAENANELQRLSDVFGNIYQGGRTLGESLWALKILMKSAGLCEAYMMPPLQQGPAEDAQQLVQDLAAHCAKENVQHGCEPKIY